MDEITLILSPPSRGMSLNVSSQPGITLQVVQPQHIEVSLTPLPVINPVVLSGVAFVPLNKSFTSGVIERDGMGRIVRVATAGKIVNIDRDGGRIVRVSTDEHTVSLNYDGAGGISGWSVL